MARVDCRVSSVCFALALLVSCLGWGSGTALAQKPEQRPDVRVVVDVSGSMKRNDPDQLAASAMELLVSLLPGGVSAGVWTFGERVDNPLPLGEVSEQWRERALALPPALRDYQQYTDIETALEQAASAEANGWRHLILMTDGVIDLPPSRGNKPGIDEASRQRLVESMAPRFADRGVVVHAIAFSDEADLALVEQLAQRTGGLASVAKSPESLLGAFLDIIERIFPADQLPLEEDDRFVVDPSVENLSALVFHGPDEGPVTLVAPDGTRYTAETAPDDIRWQVEPHFDLIRVPDPEAGEWRIEGPVGPKSRVSVSSPWRLSTSGLPTTLYRGFPVPVEAWLEHEDAEAPLPDNLRFSVTLVGDGDETLASEQLDATTDGRFRGRLSAPMQTGNARLLIRARGEGFERQRGQAVNILPAIGVAHDPASNDLVLAAEHPRLNRDNTEIHGDFQGQRLEAAAVDETRWRLPLPELEDDTSQPLLLVATVTLDGETRELTLPTVTLNANSEVGIGRPDMAGPTLSAERFAEADEATVSEPEVTIADRFVEWVNAVPALVGDAWQAGWPGVERAVAKHGRDPRLWIVIGALLLLWLVSIGWRRHRRSRGKTREEPHV
ncbi:vWA domain-containing protein [Halomonas elongata]|uniref:vWA domain-containing protein n=1 Tax=Halomonas elongata TaxID=2746 RepID=UPI00186B64E9|nr:vWA domain-containing protein [Halomonas elongata]MBW5798676.1 VWA domain-containing protein [Halomonas elongata]